MSLSEDTEGMTQQTHNIADLAAAIRVTLASETPGCLGCNTLILRGQLLCPTCREIPYWRSSLSEVLRRLMLDPYRRSQSADPLPPTVLLDSET